MYCLCVNVYCHLVITQLLLINKYYIYIHIYIYTHTHIIVVKSEWERWNNKFCYKVGSCWLFLLSHTMMHGSMNIKLNSVHFSTYLCGA